MEIVMKLLVIMIITIEVMVIVIKISSEANR